MEFGVMEATSTPEAAQLWDSLVAASEDAWFWHTHNNRLFHLCAAQKSDARQINKNLVVSEGAVVDTKPQLEIFADDVKCAHGAAVGELDEDALFYLRSRGLGREAARSLLTYAFASEMVNLIPLAPLRARVRELVTSRLPDRDSLREVA